MPRTKKTSDKPASTRRPRRDDRTPDATSGMMSDGEKRDRGDHG